MKNKRGISKYSKGVSPLIATVLLVAFSVALGAIVMNFTQTSTYEMTEQADRTIDNNVKCSLGVLVKLIDIDNNPCYNRSSSRNFEAVVENQGDTNLEGVVISFIDSDNNIYTKRDFTPLGAHNRTKYNVSLKQTDVDFEFSFPPIKITISPILSRSGSEINVCTDNRIDVEEIEICE